MEEFVWESAEYPMTIGAWYLYSRTEERDVALIQKNYAAYRILRPMGQFTLLPEELQGEKNIEAAKKYVQMLVRMS